MGADPGLIPHFQREVHPVVGQLHHGLAVRHARQLVDGHRGAAEARPRRRSPPHRREPGADREALRRRQGDRLHPHDPSVLAVRVVRVIIRPHAALGLHALHGTP